MRRKVAVLLYPGCIFFEIALATETLAQSCEVMYFTPDGLAHQASNGAVVQPAGSYADLEQTVVACVLVPGGDPRSIVIPENKAKPCLLAAAGRGALLAGICAGNLVLASSGLLRGIRATHNYTAEHSPPEKVDATKHIWEGMHFLRANVVVDGQFITAQPWAYREYAAAVAQSLGVLSREGAENLVRYPRRAYNDA